MATIAKLSVLLGLNADPFAKGMKQSAARADTFKDSLGGINSALGALGIGLSASAIISFAKEATAAYETQVAAERKLQAVLEATGGAAGFTAAQLKDYASQLQAVTNFGDETTISATAVLASFKNIQGTTFLEAIKSAQDMSSVMGTDLQSSVVQLGKALNDPMAGLSALTRVGVTFSEQQKEQIKVLQESGDVIGAQAIILKELQTEFGGAAESMQSDVVGLSNAWGDLKESIGALSDTGPMDKFFEAATVGVRGVTSQLNKLTSGDFSFKDLFGIGAITDEIKKQAERNAAEKIGIDIDALKNPMKADPEAEARVIEAAKEAAKMKALEEEQKAAEKQAKEIAKLQEEMDRERMKQEEAQQKELAQRALDSAKEEMRLRDEAGRIRASVDPAFAAAQELADAKQSFFKGFLDIETFGKVADQISQGLAAELAASIPQVQLGGAIEAGSQEDISVRNRFLAEGGRQNTIESLTKQSNEKLKKLTDEAVLQRRAAEALLAKLEVATDI